MLDMHRPPFFTSLVDLLYHRATKQPNDRAYIFLSDQGDEEAVLTFAELDRRASAVAARLAQRSQTGDRALLLFGPGLDFIIAYFGCLLAGVIAVPMMLPRRNSSLDSSASILADCSPRFAMTNAHLSSARPDVFERFQGYKIEWLILDPGWEQSLDQNRSLLTPRREDIAFLQYTSGSTSDPKGVMVTHSNLIENLEMIRLTLGNTRQSTYASWVPLYHDMGLILNVLQSLYLGALCVLLAPVTFIQRPLTWLRAIHDYRAEVAGVPNFAFDLCVERFRADQVKGLDLSCWKLAFNAAEPIRADTIERFAATFGAYGFEPRAMYPLYGMAEATLLISSGRRGAGPVIRTVSLDAFRRHQIAAPAGNDEVHRVVGCGRNIIGQRMAIVDPETKQRLGADRIGEVWVGGPHVCKGYWRNPDATRSTFQARIGGKTTNSGCAPAISASWTKRESCSSPAASRMSSSCAASTTILRISKTRSTTAIQRCVGTAEPHSRCSPKIRKRKSSWCKRWNARIAAVSTSRRSSPASARRSPTSTRSRSTRSCSFALAPFRRRRAARFQRSLARRLWLQNSFEAIDVLST